MKIGELAGRSGFNASAIRYYEQCGLVAAPNRIGGQRRYSEEAVYQLLLVRFAGDMGFTLAEIKLFLCGLRSGTPVGKRWRKLARHKIKAVDEARERSKRLRSLLDHMLRCRCGSLKVCVERLSLSPALPLLARGGRAQAGLRPAPTDPNHKMPRHNGKSSSDRLAVNGWKDGSA
jgi:MerR family redox-sensitive transcriptional activator SoxR